MPCPCVNHTIVAMVTRRHAVDFAAGPANNVGRPVAEKASVPIRPRSTWRIIDANLNRAREAARVAEEYARFALDSVEQARRLKEIRHRLRELAGRFGPRLIAARDTPGDVGTEIATPAEGERATSAAVAAAALKRLQEALRVIEEYAKTECMAAAEQAETLRYEAYAIETDLLAPRRLADAGLYVIVITARCQGRDVIEVTRAAIRGGADIIQLREKEMGGAELLALAKSLRAVTAELGALLIINDCVEVAAAADADGVHLGPDDLPAAEARALLGPGAILGVSARSGDAARQAAADGADYLGVGAVFPTGTKAGADVGGPDRIREVSAAVSIPVYPIGGITADNVASVVAAGADRVAVCSAVIGAGDVEAAARAIKNQLPMSVEEDADE